MKTTYTHLLFDLDGTLTDPMEGITRSVQYSLRHFGIEVTDLRSLTPFIGPPLAESFREFYGFDDGRIPEAIRLMREYFSEQGWRENRLYDGMPQLLERLCASGLTLAVATSKPVVFARRILDHFDLARYFAFVGGAELDGSRQAKADVIAHVLQGLGGVDPATCLMIGDRRHDVAGSGRRRHGFVRRAVGLRQPCGADRGRSDPYRRRSRRVGTDCNRSVSGSGPCATLAGRPRRRGFMRCGSPTAQTTSPARSRSPAEGFVTGPSGRSMPSTSAEAWRRTSRFAERRTVERRPGRQGCGNLSAEPWRSSLSRRRLRSDRCSSVRGGRCGTLRRCLRPSDDRREKASYGRRGVAAGVRRGGWPRP